MDNRDAEVHRIDNAQSEVELSPNTSREAMVRQHRAAKILVPAFASVLGWALGTLAGFEGDGVFITVVVTVFVCIVALRFWLRRMNN